MTYKEAVDLAYMKMERMGQNRGEILRCAKFIEDLGPTNVLEIGTQWGGTFYVWCCLSTGAKISVDMVLGPFGGVNQESTENRNKIIRSDFPNSHFIAGDSHEQATKDQVADRLGGEKVDFLFIDADHTYEGVKKDYEMYKGFVRSGGWIGFHDINEIEECEVDRLWSELQGEKVEINDHASWVSWRTNIGGIGLLKT